MRHIGVICDRHRDKYIYFGDERPNHNNWNQIEEQTGRTSSTSFASETVELTFGFICILQFSRIYFNFRFAKEYSGIHKLVITFSFLWGLSTICNTLLMVQTEIVESSPYLLCFTAFMWFIFKFSVKKLGRCIWTGEAFCVDILGFCFDVYDVSGGWQRDQSIRCAEQCHLADRMVLLSNRCTKKLANHYDGYSGTSVYTRIWKCAVHTRNVQKSIRFSYLK